MLQIIVPKLFAQTVSTPYCTSVEVNSYSAGNTALFELEAANYLNGLSWAGNVTQTAPATGVYNCHNYAWAGTSYWMTAWTKAALNAFDRSNINSTPPSGPYNVNRYWQDGSYTEVSESNATHVFYGSSNWQWVFGSGWKCPDDHSAKRITSGANAGKYESKWGNWGCYIHAKNESPYDASNCRYFKETPPPAYYIKSGSDICGYPGQGTYYVNSSGYAGVALYAYATSSSPNNYVWSAMWGGQCNAWFQWPNGSMADHSIYLNYGQSGGLLRVECKMYNGGTLLGTAYYYMTISP